MWFIKVQSLTDTSRLLLLPDCMWYHVIYHSTNFSSNLSEYLCSETQFPYFHTHSWLFQIFWKQRSGTGLSSIKNWSITLTTPRRLFANGLIHKQCLLTLHSRTNSDIFALSLWSLWVTTSSPKFCWAINITAILTQISIMEIKITLNPTLLI